MFIFFIYHLCDTVGNRLNIVDKQINSNTHQFAATLKLQVVYVSVYIA